MSPLLALALYLAVNHVAVMQARFDEDAAHQARTIAMTIDDRIEAQIAGLRMLAASPLVDDPSRWSEFYETAKSYQDAFGGNVILADRSMQMLFNTRSPFGAKLPKLPVPKGHAAAPTVIETGRPSVGDSFMGPIAGLRLVSVIVPVQREGKTKYLLLGTFETRRFLGFADRLTFPAEWSMTVLDGTGEVMASNSAGRSAAGGRKAEATKSFVAQPRLADWSVVLEMPARYYWAPMLNEAFILALGLLVVAVFSFAGGRLFARRLTRSVAGISSELQLPARSPRIEEIEAVRARLEEDLAERGRLEEAKKLNEDRYRALVDQASDAFFVHDFQGRFIEVNQRACESLGYTKEELLGMSVTDVELDFDLESAQQQWAKIEAGTQFTLLGHQKRRNGSVFPVEVRFGCSIWMGQKLYLRLVRDITERVVAEGRLQQSLVEKEGLIRELYHRTYNNMQLIQAMMVVHASMRPDMSLTDFTRLIAQKIDVMAFVHRRLYDAGDLSRIDLGAYLTELGQLVLKNHPGSAGRIALNPKLQRVSVLFDIAIPIGLVVHELLTKAVDRAFPDQRSGALSIVVSREASGIIELRVADDGVDRLGDEDSERADPGLRLIVSIIEEQLKGSISADHASGTSYTIRFTDDQYMVRV
jgi:PAS domain S-box-containing protein